VIPSFRPGMSDLWLRVRRPAQWQGWQHVRRLEEILNQQWGLGCDRTGEGYRARLRRLCEFLQVLDGGAAKPEVRGFARIQGALAAAVPPTGASDATLNHMLGYYRTELERKNGESPLSCLNRLQAWQQSCLHLSLPGFCILGVFPKDWRNLADPKANPVAALVILWTTLDCLEKAGAPIAQIEAARARWQECFDNCLSDWEWAQQQVVVRLARECLEKPLAGPLCCERADFAAAALEIAIPSLEKAGSLQSHAQGLYGLFARSNLHRARETADLKERRKLIESALTFARCAVENKPGSVAERLILLEVLSILGDSHEIEVQAEIALGLDSGPTTLQTIGRSFWDRLATVRGRKCRRRVLRQAAVFFSNALDQIESAPFDGKEPLEQAQAHGWAHFWLGRFQCELGRYQEAGVHLRTASALGFQRAESLVEFAQACVLARDREQAEQAFDDAESALAGSSGTNAPDSEEGGRSFDDLRHAIALGRSFLYCEWRPDRALALVTQAEALLKAAACREQTKLLSGLHEARGRAYLAKNDLEKAEAEFEQALQGSVAGGAACCLGLVKAEQAKSGDPGALTRAREAFRIARESDVRDRYRSEIWILRCRLRALESLPIQAHVSS
jgi:tetratricopeptide (TPR) repeat protein